jgi:hypothetical protein
MPLYQFRTNYDGRERRGYVDTCLGQQSWGNRVGNGCHYETRTIEMMIVLVLATCCIRGGIEDYMTGCRHNGYVGVKLFTITSSFIIARRVTIEMVIVFVLVWATCCIRGGIEDNYDWLQAQWLRRCKIVHYDQ